MSLLSLRSRFSSAHLYSQPAWSHEKNREVFGRCFTKHGHGHNYLLEVEFVLSDDESSGVLDQGSRAGVLDSSLDLLMDPLSTKLQIFQALLDSLTQVVDHQHLNFDIPYFKERIPTLENIALYFKEQLQDFPVHLVRVFEADDLWTELHEDAP